MALASHLAVTSLGLGFPDSTTPRLDRAPVFTSRWIKARAVEKKKGAIRYSRANVPRRKLREQFALQPSCPVLFAQHQGEGRTDLGVELQIKLGPSWQAAWLVPDAAFPASLGRLLGAAC